LHPPAPSGTELAGQLAMHLPEAASQSAEAHVDPSVQSPPFAVWQIPLTAVVPAGQLHVFVPEDQTPPTSALQTHDVEPGAVLVEPAPHKTQLPLSV
jgi:hypothetical protein